MEINKILVVINPVSGGVDKSNLRHHVTCYLKNNGQEAVFYETVGLNDQQKLIEVIDQQIPDVVLAAGGDGTVHMVASALLKYRLPIAILPLGSGNGLSKDLGIPQELDEALDVLKKPLVRQIDTLLVNGRFCVHVMDLGFNALVVHEFDKAGTRGPGTYIKIALQQYLAFQPKQFHIETDGGSFSGHAFMITVTNANKFGSNVTVNPHGILNDGVFEICIIEPFPKSAALGILYQLYNETIHNSDYTKIIRCTRATILNPENELMQIDGETAPAAKEITVTIDPNSLNVLLQSVPENIL